MTEIILAFGTERGQSNGMRGEPEQFSTAESEFLVHKATNSVGLVKQTQSGGDNRRKTIESAEGEQIAGPAEEFRPATMLEIEEYHRAAAMVRPFVLPTFHTSGSRAHSTQFA